MKKVEGHSMDKPWYRKMFSGASDTAANRAGNQAAEDNPEEQFARGLTCGAAGGEDQDFTRAAQWYRKAADQDHALAQFNLAMMYATGQGVAQDAAAAATWMGRAAQGGDAGAQFQLGVNSHRASVTGARTGSAELRIEAYKWLRLAAAQGYRDSERFCERLNLGMSREEVEEGNLRVAAFVPSTSSIAMKVPASATLDIPSKTELGQVVITQWQSG
jgi:uncharacterized protein